MTGRAAVVPDLSFPGNVRQHIGRTNYTVASFPGIYQDEWKQLTQATNVSCACVFYPDQDELFGKHKKLATGGCVCRQLYGERKDWGCMWFSRWATNTDEADAAGMALVVVYKRGLRGKPEGLGVSQRGEIEYIRTTLQAPTCDLEIDELKIFLALTRSEQQTVFSSGAAGGLLRLGALMRALILKAVSLDGLALECVDKSLRADREIVLAAVRNNAGALNYADYYSLREDREIVYVAVRGAGVDVELVLRHLDNLTRIDDEISDLRNLDVDWDRPGSYAEADAVDILNALETKREEIDNILDRLPLPFPGKWLNALRK